MSQTRRKRRRKHRGTPAGTLERQQRTGRSRTRQEAKDISRRRREERLSKPPTLRGSVNRAGLAALVFAVLVLVVFHRPVVAAVGLAAFMFLIYIPLGYATDKAIYNFRQRRKARAGSK
jgi:Flp pilus assembly protein TadB